MATEAVAVERVTVATLSHNQRALWFLHQLDPDSPAHNVSFAGRLRVDVPAGSLRRALDVLLRRHPILRTVYGSPARGGLDEFEAIRVPARDLDRAVREEALRPLDLARGPVFRIVLVRGESESALVLVTHHIAVDFRSVEVLLAELGALVESGGDASCLPAPPPAYDVFASWQAELLAGSEGARLQEYWERELAGVPGPLRLQGVRGRSAGSGLLGRSLLFRVPHGVCAALGSFGRDHGASLYRVLLTGFQALLLRHTGQEDVLVGTPFGGREERFADSVGNFVNMVALRGRLAPDLTFREALRRTAETVRRARAHQHMPFPLLVQRLRPASTAAAPLLQATFVFHAPRQLTQLGAFYLDGQRAGRIVAGGLDLAPQGLGLPEGQFDLSLQMTELEGELVGAFRYCPDMIEAAAVSRLAEHFTGLLAAAAADPDRALGRLSLGVPIATCSTREGPVPRVQNAV